MVGNVENTCIQESSRSSTAAPCLQQQDGPEPMTSNGEPFHFLRTAPDVLFCKGSPTIKKVIMTIQPNLLQSASKWRQTSASVAPKSWPRKGRWSLDESSRNQHQLPRVHQSPTPTRWFIFSETSPVCTYILVDCNFNFRTRLKTSPMQKAQYNMRWLQPLVHRRRQTRNKLIQLMLLMSTQALTGRSLFNRPTLLLQNR